jgi:hypothetical protein
LLPSIRNIFNQNFTDEAYQKMLRELEVYAGGMIPFRVSETPVFIPEELLNQMTTACDRMVDVILSDDYRKAAVRSVPDGCLVPGDEGRPTVMAFDFAVCTDEEGSLVPRLIELQGFPSLFYYQHVLAKMYRKHFKLPEHLNHLFGRTEDEFLSLMKGVLLNGHAPEEVILLEIEPERQNTRIDFNITSELTGIATVCLTKIVREGRELFYMRDGVKTKVRRIYNRVIFDELKSRTDLKLHFHLTEETDVEWVSHPNWFFKISKFTMPFLKFDFVPETFFLNEMKELPHDLENYVLKPLYSFAGSGVEFHVTPEIISNIKHPEHYILQRKISYAPVVQSPTGGVKTEIRLLYVWPEGAPRPVPVINLCRLSKGEMIGVKYNKDQTWVGSSVGFGGI